MNRFALFLFALGLTVVGVRHSNAFETDYVTRLVKQAKPGQTVQIPPGIYIEDVVVPPGVSLVGTDARRTLIVGSVQISAESEILVRFARISLLHAGDRISSGLFCPRGFVLIHHCLLISEGGFSTVKVGANAKVLLQNNIIAPWEYRRRQRS